MNTPGHTLLIRGLRRRPEAASRPSGRLCAIRPHPQGHEQAPSRPGSPPGRRPGTCPSPSAATCRRAEAAAVRRGGHGISCHGQAALHRHGDVPSAKAAGKPCRTSFQARTARVLPRTCRNGADNRQSGDGLSPCRNFRKGDGRRTAWTQSRKFTHTASKESSWLPSGLVGKGGGRRQDMPPAATRPLRDDRPQQRF